LADLNIDGKAITKWFSKIKDPEHLCQCCDYSSLEGQKNWGLIPGAVSRPAERPTWPPDRYETGDVLGVERLVEELPKEVRDKYVTSYIHTCVCLHSGVNN